MENNDCAQTTQLQDFNPVEAIHREIEQVSSSGLVGMLRIKTANQTILDAATREPQRPLPQPLVRGRSMLPVRRLQPRKIHLCSTDGR